MQIFKGIGSSTFVQTLLGRVLYLYICLVYKTSRWIVEGMRDEYNNGDFSYLLAFWHGRFMSDTFWFLKEKIRKKKKVSVLVSLHRDGRIVASAMDAIGIKTVDGSSKRGGAAAALESIRKLQQPANVMAIAPDGHKPGYKMTDGLVMLAKKSQRPIVLSAFSVEKGKIMKSWDKCLFPALFNKGVVLFSEPIYIPADLDKDGAEKWRQILEDRLIELTEEADRRAGLRAKVSLRGEAAGQ